MQVLLICFVNNEYFIHVNIYTDSQQVFEQVVHDVLEGCRSIALTLLHDSSSIGIIWGTKCKVLFMGGVNPDGVVAITDVNFGPEGVYSN